VCHDSPVRDVLVVLFWIWLLVALGVYSYRLYRRATQGPKSTRGGRAADGAEGSSEGGLLGRLGQSTAPPLPDGPIEARLPKSLQDRPPPVAGDAAVIPPGGPAAATRAVHPDAPSGDAADASGASEASEPVGMPRTVTLAEALQGIRMPEDLLPLVEPGEPGLVDGRRARFGGIGTNVPTVAGALGDELRRLGYSVDGLDTTTSVRAGLTATRDELSVAAVIEIDDDTGAVVVELNV
jgi:hypothetical protein